MKLLKILSILVWFSSAVHSQPVLEAWVHTESDAGPASLVTTAMTINADELALICIGIKDGDADITSVTWDGGTPAEVIEQLDTQGQVRGWIWRAMPTATQTNAQFTINISGAYSAIVSTVIRISGAATGSEGANAIDVSGGADTGATDDATPTVNILTTVANTLIIGACSDRARTWTSGSGYTNVDINDTAGSGGNVSSIHTEEKNQATATTVTVDGTLSSAHDWVMMAVAIAPVATGGGAKKRPRVMMVREKTSSFIRTQSINE